jgi:glycosyltransferase involved in cell wall biosynthesis
MAPIAYLFERFPTFTQTFCYREVTELRRQGVAPAIFSIRRPTAEPAQNWAGDLFKDVHYLPDEPELLQEVKRGIRRGTISTAAAGAIDQWNRQSDFLRLYQAGYIGMQLKKGVHLHAHFAGMAARTAYWIKQFFGINFSFTAHANDIFAPRPFAISLKRLIDSASAVVTESDYAARFLQEQFLTSATRIRRVYNGLDFSNFVRADFAATTPSIISIGRLIEKKGFADLIQACQLLKERKRDFYCEIIGEGPLEAALNAQIEAGGLRSRVKLIGPQSQEQIVQVLAAATVFVLPCTTEAAGGTDNLPTVIMEAMAAGLPVISTPLAGIPEMVEADVTGELISPGEPKALAAAIDRFITDPERARRFGDRGRELAREKFPIEKSARDLISIFQRCSEQNSGP